MNTHPHPGLGQRVPIHPSTDRASWTEYQRLLTTGGNPRHRHRARRRPTPAR